ncbi:insulin receptor substrate 2-B-like [Epinephelus moara]|uniref:insulin receptor substrate 2-B-like n=1 Tax=Epinephelus moara TaxID=300413 RepID=UPI00214E3094|nr:insulin receptor substrate 2-B-like [Epinephelus moara]
MNESAEGHNRCANENGSLLASSSPLTSVSHSSTQTWLPVESPLQPPWMNGHQMRQDQDTQDHYVDMQPSPQSHFYEELYCAGRTSNTLVPLASALLTSPGPQVDVLKQGYLGKQEWNHRKYFVLRAGSHTGLSRLEWYKSRETFTAMEKSAGKAALFGSSKQGVIYLRCCISVSRSGSSRKGHTVALYVKDQTMVLVAEDQQEQEEWYLALKKLMEEEQRDEEHGGLYGDDDGYCTLPPAAFFKEVWPVTVKPRSLGYSKSLAGESRLCLTATSLILVRVAAFRALPSVTIPLLSVRRFGHLDGLFFLELGRSAPNGPGEIWMEARDQGNTAVAQHIHEVVRETIRAQRVLPNFSWSPTSSHSQLQTLLASKGSRPKYRDKQVNVRPLGSRLAPRNPEIQTSPTKHHGDPFKPHKAEPEPSLSSTSHLSPVRSRHSYMAETGSYMKMKMDRHLPVNKLPAVVTGDLRSAGIEGCKPGEEGPEYMMMSPLVSHSSSVLPQDEYVVMASPQKHNKPAYPFLRTSFSSSTSDSDSPLQLPHHQTSEHRQPHWLATSLQAPKADAGQSQMSTSCYTRPQEDVWQVQTSAEQRQLPAQTGATSSPVRSVDGSGVVTPFVPRAPGYTRAVQASLHSGTGSTSRLQAASDQSVRRNRLCLFLPSCLQTKHRS